MPLKNNYEISKCACTKEEGFAEAPAQEFGEKGGKTTKNLPKLSTITFVLTYTGVFSAPCLMFLLPKKRGREIVWFFGLFSFS
jgi:hypothetical protein